MRRSVIIAALALVLIASLFTAVAAQVTEEEPVPDTYAGDVADHHADTGISAEEQLAIDAAGGGVEPADDPTTMGDDPASEAERLADDARQEQIEAQQVKFEEEENALEEDHAKWVLATESREGDLHNLTTALIDVTGAINRNEVDGADDAAAKAQQAYLDEHRATGDTALAAAEAFCAEWKAAAAEHEARAEATMAQLDKHHERLVSMDVEEDGVGTNDVAMHLHDLESHALERLSQRHSDKAASVQLLQDRCGEVDRLREHFHDVVRINVERVAAVAEREQYERPDQRKVKKPPA
jgi:hypothetical protein